MVETIEALVDGGMATGGPPLGPALGPMGINIKDVIDKINEQTKVFEGMKVPVKVHINTTDKTFDIEVGTPPTSSLIKKELNIEKGSSSSKTEKVGDLTMDQVKRIVEMKGDNILGNTIENAVKEILGTCVSMGVTVEGENPQDLQRMIDEGKINL